MRVISGARRGAALYCPETESIRPTTDRVKENIFNLIQGEVAGRSVLDLFAGSGAMGIEAVSRGARACVFVDSGKEAAGAVRANLKKLRFEEKAQVIEKGFEAFLGACGGKFSLVFLDPPYHAGYAGKAIKTMLKNNLLADGAVIVVESDSDEDIDGGELFLRTERIYGRVKVTVFEKKAVKSEPVKREEENL